MMKKNKRFISLFLFLIAPAAFPQQKGVVEGRVINKTDPSIIVRSAELDLVELGMGMRIIKTVTTDSAGRYRADGLPVTGRMMVRVNYKDVNYHKQFGFDATGKATVDLEVYEPTTSMAGIRVESAQMAFQMSGDQLKFLKTVTLNNATSPPRTYMNPEGNFRFSKAPGILAPPEIRVTAPGSAMPVVQTALESPDGQSYYSLYPLKPGATSFEVEQALPYANRTYAFKMKFYQDIASLEIGLTPKDMTLSGEGLSKTSTDTQQDFSIYRSVPVKAGSEVLWTLSGGTPVSAPPSPEASGEPSIQEVPDSLGRNALAIGPLLLMAFVIVLWVAFNQTQKNSQKAAAPGNKELKDRRGQLLNAIARLDQQHENQSIGQQEYARQRENLKRQLRRLSQLQKM